VESDPAFRDVYRIRNLKLSMDRYWSFFSKCEDLKLVHKQDIEAFHREESQNASTKREEKISRFKREKEAKELLKEVIKNRGGRVGFVGSTAEEEEDDETLRNFTLLLLDMAIRKSLENYFSSKEEADMLVGVIRMKEKSGGKLRPPEPDKPPQWKNFVLLPSKREELRQGVFRPSYPLPTMTVEEWAEEQMKLGMMSSGQQLPKQEEDEDSKTIKARKWDDWKDGHTKGEGNKNDNYFKRG